MKEWTILQGEVYGKYIYDAKIDGMFIKFLKLLKENNVIINIVSHKTKFPILGKKNKSSSQVVAIFEKIYSI